MFTDIYTYIRSLQVLAAECWIGPTLSLLSSLAPSRYTTPGAYMYIYI